MKPNETVDFNLRWGWAKLAKVYSVEAEKRGITMSVGYALLSIERDGTPSTKLGPRMGMEPTSLSRTLKGMEERGLIERRPDAHDGRSVRIFLTEDGLGARRETASLVLDLNARIREKLGREAADELIGGLQKLAQVLEDPGALLPYGTNN
jgi:DNA-binding MarR family transcriptional regulator